MANNGENHRGYKGDEATINVIHRWIERRKPKPKYCEECNEEKKLTLSNINNHQYTRNPDDYRWLCYSCHRKYDLQILELKC
jgi:hypothetical protein